MLLSEKWTELSTSADVNAIAAEYGISPITARILAQRNVSDTKEGIRDFLSPLSGIFHDPFMLSGMERVIFAVKEALSEGKRIRIIGDYDVDGICATYILYRGLRYFGGDVDCVIPHRITDGYGINMRLIDNAHKDGVGTIITCDNGISASEEVAHARSLGMRVIVTDHHEVPYEEKDGERIYRIPECEGLVDPKLPDDQYPFKGICGAFVALKVIEALAEKEGIKETSEYTDLDKEFMELASLATVCDVMELKDENRTLVAKGMQYMENSSNPGLKALIEGSGLSGKKLTAYSLGYVLGPCINASGRIASPIKALALIAEFDEGLAKQRAAGLIELNNSRKQMTAEWTDKALKMIEEAGELDKVIVIYLPGCHESLAGIIAGRIREKFVHPAYVLTDAESGLLKGSGRGIAAYDMYEGLVRSSHLLAKFGGHKLAAGISLEKEKLEAFKQNLNENCTLTEEDFSEEIFVDASLPLAGADMGLAREIEKLEPFGTGNDVPLFMATDLHLELSQIVGKTGNVAKYKAKDPAGQIFEMVAFGDHDKITGYISNKEKVDVLYSLSVNSFKGKDSVQYQIKHIR